MTSAAKQSSSDLVFDISELGRRVGATCTKKATVPSPGDLGVDMIGVPEGSNINLELRFSSVVEGIWVAGVAEVNLAGECSRCLEPISYTDRFELEELFFWPDKDGEEDASFVQDDHVDLDQTLRSAVVLNLPFTPRCKEDCLGLCVECGQNLNDLPEHTHEPETDARWDQLKDFFVSTDQNNFDMNNKE